MYLFTIPLSLLGVCSIFSRTDSAPLSFLPIWATTDVIDKAMWLKLVWDWNTWCGLHSSYGAISQSPDMLKGKGRYSGGFQDPMGGTPFEEGSKPRNGLRWEQLGFRERRVVRGGEKPLSSLWLNKVQVKRGGSSWYHRIKMYVPLWQRFGQRRILGIPIPKSLAFRASSSHITAFWASPSTLPGRPNRVGHPLRKNSEIFSSILKRFLKKALQSKTK